MKQGNRFYLGIEVSDENGEIIENPGIIEKGVFTIGALTKEYRNDDSSSEVKYDYDKHYFKVLLSQEETFAMEKIVEIEVRLKYTNGMVMGSEIIVENVQDSINKEVL